MWRGWLRHQERIRHAVRGSYVHRLLGERIFTDALWIHDMRAIAGGLALGVLIALTPSIPFQMLLAAGGALYFRVNLPIALAACWITNPLTAVPIYLFEFRLGRHVLEHVVLVQEFFDLYPFEGRMGTVLRESAYLWTGALLVGTLGAAGAYILVRILWRSAAVAARSVRNDDSESQEHE